MGVNKVSATHPMGTLRSVADMALGSPMPPARNALRTSIFAHIQTKSKWKGPSTKDFKKTLTGIET